MVEGVLNTCLFDYCLINVQDGVLLFYYLLQHMKLWRHHHKIDTTFVNILF